MRVFWVSVALYGSLLADIVLLTIYHRTQQDWLAVLAVVLPIAAVILKLVFWRCPHCGTYFGRNFPGSYCRHCKKPIE